MQDKNFSRVFWPILLILVGTIWMLSDLDILPKYSLITFLSLWPLILVAVGLNILIGSQYPSIRPWLAVGFLVIALTLMVFAEPLGLDFSSDLKQAEFSEPLNGAESASIILDLSVGRTNLSALQSGGELFSAEVFYRGTVSYDSNPGNNTNIHLEIDEPKNIRGINNFWEIFDTQDVSNNIKISPDIPIELTINVGVGETNIDLSELTLQSLKINGGVGEIDLTLPMQDAPYKVDVDGGVGAINITLEDDTNVSLDLNGGVGTFSIDVLNHAAIRLDAEVGVGEINTPKFLETIQTNNHVVGQGGIWESAQYSSASETIELYFRGGVGSLTVR